MSIILAKPLLLVPLSNQIMELGGRGYNSDCREEKIEGSFCQLVSFDTDVGEKTLLTRNDVQIGLIADSETYFVYYCGNNGEYTLRKKLVQTAFPKVRIEIKTLGYSLNECMTSLKNIWPKRLVWNIQNPHALGRL
jgi:hypothetical protein